MKAQEAKLKAQADWVTFIKDGAQTPKAWMFVRVVYTQNLSMMACLFSKDSHMPLRKPNGML